MPNVVLATDVPFVAPRVPIFAENLKWQSTEARNTLLYVNDDFVKQELDLPNHVEYPQEKTELEQADKELLVSTIRGVLPNGQRMFEFIPVEKDSIRFSTTPAPENGFYDTESDTYLPIPDTTVEDAVVEEGVSPPPIQITSCIPTESGWLLNYIKTGDCVPRIYTEYEVIDTDTDVSGCIPGGDFKNQPGYLSSLGEDADEYVTGPSSVRPGLTMYWKDSTNHYIDFDIPASNSIRIYLEEDFESRSGTDCFWRLYGYRGTTWYQLTERQERKSRFTSYYYNNSSTATTKLRFRLWNTSGNSVGRFIRLLYLVLDEQYPTDYKYIRGETYGDSGIYSKPIGELNTVFLKYLDDPSQIGIREPKLVIGTADAQENDVMLSLPSNLPTDTVGPHHQWFDFPIPLEHLCQAMSYTVVYCCIPTSSTAAALLTIEEHDVYGTGSKIKYDDINGSIVTDLTVAGIETSIVYTVNGNTINIYVNGELLKTATDVRNINSFAMGAHSSTLIGMGIYDYVMDTEEYEQFHNGRRPAVTDKGIVSCYNGQRRIRDGKWIDYGQNAFDI